MFVKIEQRNEKRVIIQILKGQGFSTTTVRHSPALSLRNKTTTCTFQILWDGAKLSFPETV